MSVSRRRIQRPARPALTIDVSLPPTTTLRPARSISSGASGDLQKRAHGVADAPLLPDDAPHIVLRNLQAKDDVVAAVLFRHLNIVRAVNQGAGHEFDQLFHRGSTPWLLFPAIPLSSLPP